MLRASAKTIAINKTKRRNIIWRIRRLMRPVISDLSETQKLSEIVKILTYQY